jgi:hypothetical protein
MMHMPALRRTSLAVALLMVPLSLAAGQERRGRKYVPPPPTSRITVTVVKDSNSKPVENAAVVFHSLKGDHDEGNMELKTNEQGQAVIDVIPIGETVRLQIVASGFQTFGQDYPVTTSTKTINVRLLRPGKQYSIYVKHSDAERGTGGAGTTEPSTNPPPQQ